ncbi:f-box domain-containing protein [Ophiostoma piceae UAMH 11346]|uniref:F-box domain-containing protein n=1 Tax=Ophiostoma piceae (strain UAMH 11346) TaxID=1262450 RepID=S3CNJ9_OPHP1|nr:f-box domain-containing protein [Ophiostoma piceae UAMH 11346]
MDLFAASADSLGAAIPQHQQSQDQDRQANMDTSYAHHSSLRSHPWSAPASASAGPGPLQLTSEAPHHGMQVDVQADVQADSGRQLSSPRMDNQLAAANGDHTDTGEGVVADAQPLQTSPATQLHSGAALLIFTAIDESSLEGAALSITPFAPTSLACVTVHVVHVVPMFVVIALSIHIAIEISLPNEIILHILGFLDVNDLLATSRTSHHLRCLCVAPILRIHRLRYIRAALPPLLAAPQRPSLTELIQRSIFLTNTTVVSRKLTRSLVAIRLSHRLAARPPVHVLVERCVLPPECAPGIGHVAPALAARTRAIERERIKDGLRSWIGVVWRREVGRRSERMRRRDESVGVGKVWRLRKFWERVSGSS